MCYINKNKTQTAVTNICLNCITFINLTFRMLQHTTWDYSSVADKFNSKNTTRCTDWELTKLIDIKRQEYANNWDKVSHCQRFHFKVGLRSRINRDSLILQCMSDRPVANIISKWSHLIPWLVKKTWSAITDSWQFVVRALKCSVFLSRNRRFVFPM